jgi:hypothetical protein
MPVETVTRVARALADGRLGRWLRAIAGAAAAMIAAPAHASTANNDVRRIRTEAA